MNFNTVFHLVGQAVIFLAALMMFPLFCAVIYGEDITPFVVTIMIAGTFGVFMSNMFKKNAGSIMIREGYAIVSLTWIIASVFGALPFILSGSIPSPVDAIFETVSGFTTTGASILENVEILPKGIAFWRSLTHWIGGMGILVFITAITFRAPGRSINILKAEMPGHSVDKLVPKTKKTAISLYKMYVALTFIEVVLLCAGGMSLYDSLVHAFGTAGTGGFGIRADSIASYSPYLQWVITIFMALFGLNFNLYYLLLMRNIKPVFLSNELRWALIIGLSSIALITLNILPMYHNFSEALRLSAFQVSSIMTTTGYATCDFNLWPGFSKAVLFLLMFIGGCMGSTAGGLKVSRVVVLAQVVKNQFIQALSPRSIRAVKLNGRIVDERSVARTTGYFCMYMLIIFGVFLLLSLEPFDFETNLSAAVACMNNIGPGLAKVGPAANFNLYSDPSKVLLTFTMLLGRLEIYPLILTLLPVHKMR